jgi:hypothetical protein
LYESEELRNDRRGTETHAVATKFGHDSFHGLLIFFEQQTQLFVLLLEGMVLDDNLGVGALQFRFESFWWEALD